MKFHCVDFKLAHADRRQSLWRIRDIKYTQPGYSSRSGFLHAEGALIFLIKLSKSKFLLTDLAGPSPNIREIQARVSPAPLDD